MTARDVSRMVSPTRAPHHRRRRQRDQERLEPILWYGPTCSDPATSVSATWRSARDNANANEMGRLPAVT
jgi:hypothetical protein